ncbi:MAG: cyclic nucleotide-binding protein [Spirochaetes bacterium]|nr:MAG: cyclic nucleotide-binding protein [Spirochaetota bacterium]
MSIKKVKITNGLYWVEFPDDGLYIQCGTPADSVKHLAKSGFITLKTEGGKTFETGPNAVLLSDVPVQNGSFCNLAEFPVLQMLYKQGMIIPGHPNNTGEKPLLIGTEEQVKAQSKYIYYGNYGLSTLEQLTGTGIYERNAKGILRLKRRFAYGRIRNTEELLELRIVDNEKILLKKDVYIKRKALNVYELSFKEEKVSVDLNLRKNETYTPPYKLRHRAASRDYFSVIHIGEGDGWDWMRPCMSSIISFKGRFYLIDAGPNIMASLTALGININQISGIFHTHAHDDHFAGLTTLMHSDHKIRYYATSFVRASVVKKLSALMDMEEDRFERYFDIHELELDRWNNIHGMEVKPVFSPHPVETTILFFRVSDNDVYRSYGHLADITSFHVLEGMVENDSSKDGISREFFEKVKNNYLIPADIKKIDAGGGLIHGDAVDFSKDSSREIFISHTSSPELTEAQKKVGKMASFGMITSLIKGKVDYWREDALNYLRMHFPGMEEKELQALSNCAIVSYDSGSVVMKKSSRNSVISLIIGGTVERIGEESASCDLLAAGSFVGELPAMMEEEVRNNYIAASHVKVLEIPYDMYIDFIRRNGLYQEMRRNCEKRRFLQRTWLFGEMVSTQVQYRIAKMMKVKSFNSGYLQLENRGEKLYMLSNGEIDIYFGNRKLETLRPGDFFGEERNLSGTEKMFTYSAVADSDVFILDNYLLQEIPAIQWKLLEVFEKRMRMALFPPG